jgi:hypothetical protein
MNHLRMLPAAALALLALPGCTGTLEEEVADAVVASALETGNTGPQGRFIIDARPAQADACLADAAAAAADAAARPVVGLYPAECLTKTADGVELHGEFDGCTGPFGRVTLQGGMDATFSPLADCRMHADVADSGDFTANDRPLDYSAQADITYRDGGRDVEWTAHWTGTTRRGRDIEHDSSLDVQADDATGCLAVAGTTSGHVDEWQFGTTIDGLRICPEACPEAGVVEATLEGKNRDRTIRVEFDGSNVAQVTGWTGREFEVEMVCGPAAE